MRLPHLTSLSLLAFLLAACPGGDGDGDGDNNADGGGVLFEDIDAGTVEPGDPCNGTVDCTPGSICFSNICVQDGALRFSLAWDVDTDFDLHVVTPAGNEIFYSSRMFDNGTLDVDDCVSGGCRLPDHKHVENVFFDEPMSGEYEYWVNNYDGEMAGTFMIVVAKDGDVQETKSGTLPAQDADSEYFTYTF